MVLVEAAEGAYRHVKRAILFIEAARRLDFGHLRLRRDLDPNALLDELILLARRFFEIDPGRLIGDALRVRIDDASFTAGAICAEHGAASCEQPIFASRAALLSCFADDQPPNRDRRIGHHRSRCSHSARGRGR